MRYIIADIHGDLSGLKKIIKKTDMDLENDVLYIAGDVLDRGREGLQTLNYLAKYIKRKTVSIIKGNHELFCQNFLENKLPGERWSLYGGGYTLEEVLKLSQKERDELGAFLNCLPSYIELDSSILGNTIITHSGISSDWLVYNNQDKIDVKESIKLGMEMMGEFGFLVQDDIHFLGRNQMERLDRYIICGHVPTFKLQEGNKILRTPYFMDIDCGAGYRKQGGMLACYCIDNDEVFYA